MTQKECHHLLGSLSEYVDGSLEQRLCEELERHLAECQDCRVVVDTLNKTVDLVHQSVLHIDTPDDVRKRLFRRLNLEDFLM
jgi:anti-sigma factor RsiW